MKTPNFFLIISFLTSFVNFGKEFGNYLKPLREIQYKVRFVQIVRAVYLLNQEIPAYFIQICFLPSV